eukprot:3832952-Rhodomonas_salina.1
MRERIRREGDTGYLWSSPSFSESLQVRLSAGSYSLLVCIADALGTVTFATSSYDAQRLDDLSTGVRLQWVQDQRYNSGTHCIFGDQVPLMAQGSPTRVTIKDFPGTT